MLEFGLDWAETASVIQTKLRHTFFVSPKNGLSISVWNFQISMIVRNHCFNLKLSSLTSDTIFGKVCIFKFQVFAIDPSVMVAINETK